MDLTAERNAMMLFRIAKVISKPGLAELVRNVENNLDRGVRTGSGMPGIMESGDSLSVDHDKEVVTSAAKQCLAELGDKGHNTKYVPIFGNEFRQTIVELLGVTEQAKEAGEAELKTLGENEAGGGGGGTLASWLRWVVGEGGEGQGDSKEVEDIRRSLNYQTQILTQLSSVFSVQSQTLCSPRRPLFTGHGPASPDTVHTEQGPVLSPHGRWQLLHGLVKPVISYQGDPDTRPITDAEVVFMVRMLHQLSLSINNYYGSSLRDLYERDDVTGGVARLLLAAPTHYYTVIKSINGGPNQRQLHHHK